MRRILAVLVAMTGLSPAFAAAQTCRGLAPLPAGQFQATGTGKLASGSESIGAAVLYDLPAQAFAGAGTGMTSVEAFGKSTLDLAATAGYQIAVTQQVHVCPLADVALQLGPNDAFESGVDRSTWSTALGFAAGTAFSLRPDLSLVPAISLKVGRRTHEAENSAGATLFHIVETYGVAQLHLGLVLDQNVSVRPTVELPLGLAGGNLSVGLTMGYNFGR